MQEKIDEGLEYHKGNPQAPIVTKKITQELAVKQEILTALSTLEHDRPLEIGEVILGGRYRVERHLYTRPRLNLYLGRALDRNKPEAEPSMRRGWLTRCWQRLRGKPTVPGEPLVAIREIVLTGLDVRQRICIETAGVEEFIEPIGLGAASLATDKDRVLVERGRLYLVLQLQRKRDLGRIEPITLDELLIGKPWPEWLKRAEVLQWGVQLGRMVARLHRMGIILGEIAPETLLVDRHGRAPWTPLLLTSWPPAPRFWDGPDKTSVLADFQRIFPLARGSQHNMFLAPEMLYGLYDQRTDVYALGALLYLLLTRIAPIASMRRLRAAHHLFTVQNNDLCPTQRQEFEGYEGLELIPPRFWCEDISERLEQVILKALALDPNERYDSVFSLVEDLEALEREESAKCQPVYKHKRFLWF